ncbi:carbohydrate kinase family protein [Nocardia yunnanensis]|uniref:Carbohydrate kinase family protein n=1 Tax=Nocardia yunnanensis TaxID=2382165 RepID=A0A386ZPZ5_9NOCA|nr:carbohydrate kinase family protein [Nocardia yunnanensis]
MGFGALNVDVIATASGLSERAAEQITESTARFEWNREGATDRESILEIRNIGTSSLNFSLGGSAWLTIYALAKMRLGLHLGYICALGRIEAPGVSFRAQMRELGIDDRWVGQFNENSCGLCLSFIDNNERVMHTNPGANLRMAEHLRTNLDAVAAYIASARCVHVTSFLDDQTPTMVATVLERARNLNPNLCISIDQGPHAACGRRGHGYRRQALRQARKRPRRFPSRLSGLLVQGRGSPAVLSAADPRQYRRRALRPEPRQLAQPPHTPGPGTSRRAAVRRHASGCAALRCVADQRHRRADAGGSRDSRTGCDRSAQPVRLVFQQQLRADVDRELADHRRAAAVRLQDPGAGVVVRRRNARGAGPLRGSPAIRAVVECRLHAGTVRQHPDHPEEPGHPEVGELPHVGVEQRDAGRARRVRDHDTDHRRS